MTTPRERRALLAYARMLRLPFVERAGSIGWPTLHLAHDLMPDHLDEPETEAQRARNAESLAYFGAPP